MPTIIGFDESVRPKCTCRGCGAIVRYMKTEVQTIRGTDYGGGPDGCDYITCPNCGDQITLRSW